MLIFLRKPSDPAIDAHLARFRSEPFSYAEVGASRGLPPPGYTVDNNRVRLGEGEGAFERAKEAVRRWEMFRLGWGEICWPDAPIEAGTVVGVLMRPLGVWSLNGCRIVYTVDEAEGSGEIARRFGFAYGTLPDHGARGEERFTVELRRDGSVWYDILALSRPNGLLPSIGKPALRLLQRRFAADSLRAMRLALAE